MNTVEPGHRYAAESAMLLHKRQMSDDSLEITRLFQSDALKRRDSAAVNAMFLTFFRASFADRSRVHDLHLHVNQRTATNMLTVASLVMGPLGPSFDLWPEAAAIRVPTLIVHGVEDLVPREMPRDLAHTIPNAKLVMIDGAGHFPYIERPRETLAAIDDFVSRVGDTGSRGRAGPHLRLLYQRTI
jgi:pimeloyl-ACP methyl ester carboxylesterase